MNKSLSPEVKMHACWGSPITCQSAQNYLCDNPVIEKPLTLEHVKPRLLGYWGTTPGLHFIYIHLNRIIMAIPNNIDRFHSQALHPPLRRGHAGNSQLDVGH